jgi:hypothetical protein
VVEGTAGVITGVCYRTVCHRRAVQILPCGVCGFYVKVCATHAKKASDELQDHVLEEHPINMSRSAVN